ncbi:MAG: metallopeptidase family protein [Actinomycetes bacterium]
MTSGGFVRRRDRHGRGLRGPLAPPGVPISISRSTGFDELVLDSVERVEQALAPRLATVDVVVHNVPPVDVITLAGGPVPLGHAVPATDEHPPRIVVYRRPIELRAGTNVASLVYEVVLEQAAALLGISPDEIDPRYEP